MNPAAATTEEQTEERRLALAHARARGRPAARAARPSSTAGAASGTQPRIGLVDGMLMLITALVFDGLQALFTFLLIGVVLNPVVAIFAWLTFFIWFKMKGMSFGAARGRPGGGGIFQNPLAIIAASFGLELFPFINSLPTWTAAVVTTIVLDQRRARSGAATPARTTLPAHLPQRP